MRTHDPLPAHPPAILIVDDDAPTLELYAGALGRHYRVFVCSGHQDVLEFLSTEPIHLVVLEPSVAGYDAWQLLEQIVKAHSVPVIVCSTLDERRAGRDAGASAYLIKPVLPATLLKMVKSILT
jgi:DNA-binding response OmpR family regulator